MSWNVIIMPLQGSPFDPTEPPVDDAILGDVASVRAKLEQSWPELQWTAADAAVFRSARWHIEVNLQADGPVESFLLHVQGAGDPVSAVSRLCRDHGWVAFDTAAGDYLHPEHPSNAGWLGYQALRDGKVEPPETD